jgi:hypothetical protein
MITENHITEKVVFLKEKFGYTIVIDKQAIWG